MQLIAFFEILLLVAIVAGIFICWDRRPGEAPPREAGGSSVDSSSG